MRTLFFLVIFITICCKTYALDGCSYETFTYLGQTVNVVNVDPLKFNIDIKMAAALEPNGMAHIKDIAKHHQAIAAINGGFFRNTQYNYVAAGLLRVNGYWHGIAYNPRAAIGWISGSNAVLIDRITTETKLNVANNLYNVTSFNPKRTSKRNVLFSYDYSPKIAFAEPTTAITIQTGKITAISSSEEVDILANSYIYATTPEIAKQLTVNMAAIVDISLNPQLAKDTKQSWQQMPFVLGGTPILVKNNKIITDYYKEQIIDEFIYDKHGRTAICIMPDNLWKLIVVEENLLTNNLGVTIPELAKLMQQLSCKDAINLDGGSSTALYGSEQLFATNEPLVINGKAINNAVVVTKKVHN